MPSAPKTSRRQHSSEKITVILKLHNLGLSASKISNETDIPKSTITRIIRDHEQQPNQPLSRPKRPGRPPKLSRRSERALMRYVAKNPRDTLEALSTPSKSGYQLHPKTIRRYLKNNEVYAFKPRKKPFLSKKHKADRLKWAKEYIKWTIEDWACVSFSDESTFELGFDNTPSYIRRKKGRAFESQYLLPTFKSGRSSIGIWGCINLNLHGKVVILPEKARMNSGLYIDLILNQTGHLFYEQVMEEHGDAIWQDDGAKYHTSKEVKEWQKSMFMRRMIWPAQSPDLNPIENLWYIIKRRISKRRHRIMDLKELGDIIKEEWDQIDREVIVKIISTMHKRCLACIKARGGHTKY